MIEVRRVSKTPSDPCGYTRQKWIRITFLSLRGKVYYLFINPQNYYFFLNRRCFLIGLNSGPFPLLDYVVHEWAPLFPTVVSFTENSVILLMLSIHHFPYFLAPAWFPALYISTTCPKHCTLSIFVMASNEMFGFIFPKISLFYFFSVHDTLIVIELIVC